MSKQTLYYKRTYYKKSNFIQPVLSSNGSLGGSTFAVAANSESSISEGGKAYHTFDNQWYYWRAWTSTGWLVFYNPAPLRVSKILWECFYMYPTAGTVEGSNDGTIWTKITDWTNTRSDRFDILVNSNADYKYHRININKINYDYIHCREIDITAAMITDGSASDHDYYEDLIADESDYDFYIDDRVDADDDWTYTTEVEISDDTKGANLIYGRRHFGRFIYAGSTAVKEGGGVLPEDKTNYLPDVFTVIAYKDDGTKTAIFGAGSESNSLKQLTFEIVETGCGKVELTFNKLPENTELDYKQRIDIHLFNDAQPWYSGYILQRPIKGTTTTDSFKFIGHGYYNLLEKIIVNRTYENMEVSAIVFDIARDIEKKIGLTLNSDKIINTGYTITKIELDHVTAKEALSQLSDFAIDYVYGIDEYRQLYFKPRTAEINEQARLWVGQHLTKYEPAWNIEDIVNHAYIKGGNVDDEGEQWLAEVEDKESQKLYKIQEDVLTLPSAYSAEDAERWGESQLTNLAKPKKSAKISQVKLEYPRADGTFFVRKLSTQGQAAITTLDGELFTYPISKLKYTVSSDKGIQLDMELGEIPDAIDRYFANLDRDAKLAELLQQAATKQLKTGG